MRELRDGDEIVVQGSTGTYTIKRVGDVYSCECMAWRTQPMPVNRRTCKHLRKLRGDAAEDTRIGLAAAPKAAAPKFTPEYGVVAAIRLPAPQDTEAVVLEYRTGGAGLVGLRCRTGDGQTVSVQAGFSDRDRVYPPPVGAIVTLRFQEVTAGGAPVNANFAGIRPDDAPTLPPAPRP